MSTVAQRRVALPAEEYWQLRALMADIQVARRRAREAEARACAYLTVLGHTHGFDSRRPWSCDDATMSITEAS